MFLATTALTEFWDLSDQLLFLGPWCTPYDQRHQWAHLASQVLPNPWDDREKLHQAGRYCQRVFEHLLGELSGYLNRVHGVNFGERYWRVLLGPWLLHFVDVYHDRFVCLREAFTGFPGITTWLLRKSDYRTPVDLTDSSVLYYDNDLYNLQLYSQILRGMGYSFPEKGTDAGHPLAQRQNGGKKPVWQGSRALRGLWQKVEAWVFGNRLFGDEVLCHPANLGRWNGLRLVTTPGFRGRCFFEEFSEEPLPPADLGSEARRGLGQLGTLPDTFTRILGENLSVNFPRRYLEGYRASRQRVLERFQGKRFPRVFLTLAGLYFDELAKFLAAELTERKGRIISLQHGGGYGIALMTGAEALERTISDRFYCWGWAGQENDLRLLNLPAPKLSVRPRPPGISGRRHPILLVGTSHPRYLYRFQSSPMGTQWEAYIQATGEFLQELGPSWRTEVLYRGYVREYGWRFPLKLAERFPDLTTDPHARSFRFQLQRCRMAVFDHPDTPFLEAMAANVPTILFFDPRLWEQREAARPYFDALRAAGIVHDFPQSAAKQVKAVYPQVDDWWFSHEVQHSRERFASHFALTNRDWPRLWVKMLHRELGEGAG